MTEEPHRTRRMAIMKAHPEVSVELASDKFVYTFIKGHQINGTRATD
jgi:hypothetical protein